MLIPLENITSSVKSLLALCTAAAAAAKSLQSCLTPCDPIDGSPPGFPVPGILQARTLEWVAISFSNAWKWKMKVKSLSPVWLLVTPWTAAYQAPPCRGFSRPEYWSGVCAVEAEGIFRHCSLSCKEDRTLLMTPQDSSLVLLSGSSVPWVGAAREFFQKLQRGFPGASASKESACSAGDPGSISGLGRSPGEGNGNPLQYSCLENRMGRGAWRATIHGVAESDMTENAFTFISQLSTTEPGTHIHPYHTSKGILESLEIKNRLVYHIIIQLLIIVTYNNLCKQTNYTFHQTFLYSSICCCCSVT